MKRLTLAALLLLALVVAMNGRVSYAWTKVALASTPTPPACVFAGYGENGNLINTTIVCVTPTSGGTGPPGGVTTVAATATACGAAVQPSPTAGAVVVKVPVCPTASPQITPSPTATSTSTNGPPSVSWSGSYPYQIGVNFPVVSGSSGGVTSVTATALPCGSGVFVTHPTPSPVVEVQVCPTSSPQITPSPTATSTSTAGPPSCLWAGTYPYQLECNFPQALGTSTPAPTVTSSGPPITVSFDAGANVYSVGCNTGAATQCLSNATGAILFTTSPTSNPTTQPGYIQVTGGLSVGPQPNPIGSLTPDAISIATTGCTGANYTKIGTTGSTVVGIPGSLLGVGCGSNTYLAMDDFGDLGIGAGLVVGSTSTFTHEAYFPTSTNCPSHSQSSILFACNGGIAQIWFGASGSACAFDWADVIASGMQFSCPFAVKPLSNGSTTPAYVAPVFTHTGTATDSTLHGSQFSCTFSTSLSCDLGAAYWTNGAVFVTISGCDVSTTGTDGAVFTVGSKSTNTAIIYSSIVTSDVVTGICWGS